MAEAIVISEGQGGFDLVELTRQAVMFDNPARFGYQRKQ